MPQESAEVDLVVRNGLIVDGTGVQPCEGDVAIRDGKIVDTGTVEASGKKEIDAKGCIVTPGFVDIHTHYDGHATWENHIRPSSNHGVTTVVTGNCGVGFAPCRPADRQALLALMEGIEDIPEPVLAAGLPWNWRSFPEFLDVVGARHFDMDIAMQLPHAPLRVFVMGQRGIDREAATPDDIAAMAKLAREAVAAGAIGFSTTRAINHKFNDGRPSPVYTAAEEELTGIAIGMSEACAGVFQLITDFEDHEREFDMLERIAKTSGRPLSVSVFQRASTPQLYADTLGRIARGNARGIELRGQVCCRPTGGLFGLALRGHAFSFCPSYQRIAELPLAEQVQAMRDPQLRSAILAEFPTVDESDMLSRAVVTLDLQYELDENEPDYEPARSDSVAATAERLGLKAAEYMYDRLLADEGNTVFFFPSSGWAEHSIDAIEAMMIHPNAVHGLGDGGAHCGQICDASQQTYMLTRWAKGRHGRSLPLERIVRMMTHSTATAVGLKDRGVIAAGHKGDLNIIDLDRLTLHRPEMVYDLPSGAGRLHQRATGYVATIVNGVVTQSAGEATGALPGRLVRGQRQAPAADQ
ncbi:MAG: amidohydrolase family protein [Novosphingobium sp.]|nr:amidohydrolase family protein [Novosphingobium sp.]